MMSSTEQTKKPKAPSAQQLQKQSLKDQKTKLLTEVKAIDEKIANLSPKKTSKKSKVVLTETMRLAQTVGKQLTEMVDETKDGKPTGKKVAKRVASKSALRSKCASITGLNNLETELKRQHVESVAKEAIALLITMPKPPKASRPKPSK